MDTGEDEIVLPGAAGPAEGGGAPAAEKATERSQKPELPW